MSLSETRIQEAEAAVEAVRRLLLTPTAESLERGVPELERAIRSLQSLQEDPPREPALRRAAATALLTFQKALAGIAVLLESASDFYASWGRQFSAAAYTPSGEAVAPAGRGNLSLEG